MRYWLIILLLFIVPTLSAAPAFNKMDKEQRYPAFFNYFRPFVKEANDHVLQERKELLHLYALRFTQNNKLSDKQQHWLTNLFYKYRITMTENRHDWEHLLRRVDAVPEALALAQAANETNAGITRFAQQANNFYGMWCNTPGCGLVPLQRNKGDSHEIKKYPSAEKSVEAYMLNLNTNDQYKIFRDLRAQQRSYGEKLSGVILASGLLAYSQTRDIYVQSLQRMIVKYQLEKTLDYNA